MCLLDDYVPRGTSTVDRNIPAQSTCQENSLSESSRLLACIYVPSVLDTCGPMLTRRPSCMYTVHCTLYTVYSVEPGQLPVHCTLYTVYTVEPAQLPVYCTLYTVEPSQLVVQQISSAARQRLSWDSVASRQSASESSWHLIVWPLGHSGRI